MNVVIRDWSPRLTAAIEESGRSMREISLKARLGPNYLFSILKEGKEPSIERLMALADELGVSITYLLLGVEMSGDTEQLLGFYAAMDADQKKALRELARQMARKPSQ